jgi:hypothetical protein
LVLQHGRRRHTLTELLRPLEAAANPAGMTLAETFAVHGAGFGLDDEALALHAKRYRDVLTAA